MNFVSVDPLEISSSRVLKCQSSCYFLINLPASFLHMHFWHWLSLNEKQSNSQPLQLGYTLYLIYAGKRIKPLDTHFISTFFPDS